MKDIIRLVWKYQPSVFTAKLNWQHASNWQQLAASGINWQQLAAAKRAVLLFLGKLNMVIGDLMEEEETSWRQMFYFQQMFFNIYSKQMFFVMDIFMTA